MSYLFDGGILQARYFVSAAEERLRPSLAGTWSMTRLRAFVKSGTIEEIYGINASGESSSYEVAF